MLITKVIPETYQRNIQTLRKLGLSRVVVSAGMPRSGSTLLFNIIRLCLEAKYGDTLVSGYFGNSKEATIDLSELPSAKVFLLKTHNVGLIRYRANNIFYSYRDVREALVSLKLKFKERAYKVSIKTARNWISQYNQAKNSSKYFMLRYEDFTQNLPQTILQISSRLNILVDHVRILNNLPPKYTDTSIGIDHRTLMHGGHSSGTITGSWRYILSEKLQKELIEEFGWWFEENRYDLE